MAFQTAKTNWTPADGVTNVDLNRIENNINELSKVYEAKGTPTEILIDSGDMYANRIINILATNGNSAKATTVNGIPVYRPGTKLPPNISAGKVYTLWYNKTGNCFFHKASAEGTALAKHVLKNYTFSNDEDTGILGTLDLDNLISANVKANVNINGIIGKSTVVDTEKGTVTAAQMLSGYKGYSKGAEIAGNITVNGNGAHINASAASVGASSGDGVNYAYLKVPKGYFDGTSFVRSSQPNFLAKNIKEGITLLGLKGTGGQYKTRVGTFNSGTGSTITLNLDITPRHIICLITDGPTYDGKYDWGSGVLIYDSTRSINKPGKTYTAYRAFTYYNNNDGEELAVNGYRDDYMVVSGKSVKITINPSSSSSINSVFQNLTWTYIAVGE